MCLIESLVIKRIEIRENYHLSCIWSLEKFRNIHNSDKKKKTQTFINVCVERKENIECKKKEHVEKISFIKASLG